MQIPCTGCGEPLPISKELLGKKIRCGACDSVVEIPANFADSGSIKNPAAVARAQPKKVPITVVSEPPKKDLSPTMLVNCTCGNRCSIPASAVGSEFRCPSCQSLMRVPTQSGATGPDVLGGFPSTNASIPSTTVLPYRGRSKPPSSHSNAAIVITAVCCLVGLIVLVGVIVGVNQVTKDPPVAAAKESEEQESKAPTTHHVEFQEGYTMELPLGFKQESREVTSRGYSVYRFANQKRIKVTVAIIPDESITRITLPPRKFSDAFVRSVPELSLDVEADVEPTNVNLMGMPGAVFRIYEPETYRGITFTYFMVVMDPGRKIVAKFSGKYGDYDDDAEDVSPPTHWLVSLKSLRKDRRVEKPSSPPS